MNVTSNTATVPVGETPFTVEANYYIDADGNRVEIPFDVTTASDGEAAQPGTAFIAEDAADHPVTVH